MMAAKSSRAPGATGTGRMNDFRDAALSYFAAHAIDPEIAAALGVAEANRGISIPYRDGFGRETYRRRRDFAAGKTIGPKGQALEIWAPVGTDGVLLVCEGEADCMAAISALFDVDRALLDDPDFDADEPLDLLTRRPDLPPPLTGIVPIAIPGVGNCHAGVADLAEELVADCVIVLDGDDPGRAGAAKLAAKIDAKPHSSTGIINLPDGLDLADVLAAADDPTTALAELLAEAEAGAEDVRVDGDVGEQDLPDAIGVSSHSSLCSQPQTPAPLGADAYYGLAGEIVKAIEPHTEADPAAVLVQLLVAVGNAAGRGPGFRVEADDHHCNLSVAIVGPSAIARKGSSFGQARRLVVEADPTWATRIVTGSSSGEGLIWLVRDPIEETRPAKGDEEGDAEGFVTELADIGVEDKRALVIEPEFASVLERMGRDGNTLSAVLRQAWDGQALDTLVKTNRAKATNAHISMIGHITVTELQRKLNATEAANGFANRFIWIYATRSKSLPFGGDLDSVDWSPYVARLADAITYANTGEQDFDEEAKALWVDVYEELTTPADGMLGAVTARAAAQVRRLAVIYSVLDPKPDGGAIVTADHLRAALEVWRYSLESAALIFGGSLGDPTADSILTQLRAMPEGMTRKEISNAFGRHQSAAELDRALTALEQRDLVFSITEATGGRPAVRWLLAGEQSEQSEQSPPGVSSLTSLSSRSGKAES